MFFLLPLWHEDTLKLPAWTSGLLVLNVVVFLIAWPLETRSSSVVTPDALTNASRELVRIILDSKIGVSDADRGMVRYESQLTPFPSEKLAAFFDRVQSDPSFLSDKDRYEWDLTYPLFDGYRKSLSADATRTTPFRTYGFRTDDWWPGVFTHMFLHAGWMHLIFNMLFFWVFGCAAEEARPGAMPYVYGLGGLGGAIAQVFWGLPSGQTMVGASGAVSAVMGFALAVHPRARVKLFYFMLLAIMPKYGVFQAPLWFFVPLWGLEQVGMALLTHKSATATVGYAAHIGGLLCGLAGGLLLKGARPEPVKESLTRFPS